MGVERRPSASIVIPAYNAARRIGKPLEALAGQAVEDGTFEVIVVDNASTDATAVLARDHPATAELGRRGMEVRVIREGHAGSNHARLRGLAEARGDCICFLDDDNVPEVRFVAEALAAFRDPSVGLLVSRIYPEYEIPPPYSVRRREHLLAINEKLGDRFIVWGAETPLAPTIGAGMWVRRDVLLGAISRVSPETLIVGRTGNSLACGEDIEMGYLVGRFGFHRVYCPNLRIRHLIPRSRIRPIYFCRLISGIVRSELTLEAKYIKPRRSGATLFHLAKLAGAMAAVPYLLLRRDGWRETLFILADRWAHLRGPFPFR